MGWFAVNACASGPSSTQKPAAGGQGAGASAPVSLGMPQIVTPPRITKLAPGEVEPPLNPAPNLLVDSYGRRHRDLRISLTDRCNLRCTYCMPEEGMDWIAAANMLTLPEMTRIAAVAVACGVDEIRLTGGEPLMRPDIVAVVESLANLPGAPEISMTTNGLRLDRLAPKLKAAGLTRFNVSLDTIDRDRYLKMTRRDRIHQVFAGLDAIDAAGFTGTKLNAVLMTDMNEDEAPTLLRFALERGYELRIIEQMPLDAGHSWSREGMVTADEILASIEAEFALTPVPARGAAPAERWYVNGTDATVGVIASVTRPFCGACDRIRLTSDGQLRNCLFARTETDLRSMLRAGCTDDDIATALGLSINQKLPGHGINDPDFIQPERGMSAIGG